MVPAAPTATMLSGPVPQMLYRCSVVPEGSSHQPWQVPLANTACTWNSPAALRLMVQSAAWPEQPPDQPWNMPMLAAACSVTWVPAA